MTDNVHASFLARDAVRLTGLTMSQLARWDREGFFAPQYAEENRRSPYSRVYSFKDVVGLRTISDLRGKHGVSFSELRRVAQELSKYSAAPWADFKLWVWNRKVHFREPETGREREVTGKQFVLFQVADVQAEVEASIDSLRQRAPDQIGQVERHRYVVHNAWVIAGTRIPVKAVQAFARAGYTPEQIRDEYPTLTIDDIQVALAVDLKPQAA